MMKHATLKNKLIGPGMTEIMYCRIANLIRHCSAIISVIPRYSAFIPRKTRLLATHIVVVVSFFCCSVRSQFARDLRSF